MPVVDKTDHRRETVTTPDGQQKITEESEFVVQIASSSAWPEAGITSTDTEQGILNQYSRTTRAGPQVVKNTTQDPYGTESVQEDQADTEEFKRDARDMAGSSGAATGAGAGSGSNTSFKFGPESNTTRPDNTERHQAATAAPAELADTERLRERVINCNRPFYWRNMSGYLAEYVTQHAANVMRSVLYQWRGRTVAHSKGDRRIKERVIGCNSLLAETVTPDVLKEEWWKTFIYNTEYKISEYLMASTIAHKLRIWNRQSDDNYRLTMDRRLERSEGERGRPHTHSISITQGKERRRPYVHVQLSTAARR